MNQTRLEISVGAFVIVGLAAIAYVALKIGAGLLVGTDTYLVNARFNNASGLSAGGKVTISGVTIGSVERVKLDPADYSAVATLRVRSDLKLPVDSLVAIRSNGLLGDRFILITPGSDQKPAAAGDFMTHTESSTDLESVISQFTGSGAPGIAPGADTYLLHARFTNATGIVPGSRVTLAGVAVGNVEGVHLKMDDFSAIVDLRLRADVKLPLDSIVSVKSSSLIGGKYLAVQLGGDPDVAANGDTLTETESALDLESLIGRFAFGSVDDKTKKEDTTTP